MRFHEVGWGVSLDQTNFFDSMYAVRCTFRIIAFYVFNFKNTEYQFSPEHAPKWPLTCHLEGT